MNTTGLEARTAMLRSVLVPREFLFRKDCESLRTTCKSELSQGLFQKGECVYTILPWTHPITSRRKSTPEPPLYENQPNLRLKKESDRSDCTACKEDSLTSAVLWGTRPSDSSWFGPEGGVYACDFILDRMHQVYLKLISESDTFLARGLAACKAPQTMLMVLPIIVYWETM
jgi:hypothetical protein